MEHTLGMNWFKDGLKTLRFPYELRWFYNLHKKRILANPSLYRKLTKFARSWKSFTVCTLDKKTIDNFLFDIESEREEYIEKQKFLPTVVAEIVEEEVSESKPLPIMSHLPPPASKSIERARAKLKPSKFIKIEILSAECDNFYEEAQREMFRMALDLADTNTELSKLLGLSLRTVRNHLNDLTNEGMNHEKM